MDSISVKTSNKNTLVLATSLAWKFYEWMFFLTSLLALDFQIKRELGDQALFSAKIAFLIHFFLGNLPHGHWLKSLPYLLPFSMILMGFAMLGRTNHYRFDKVSGRISVQKGFYFIPIQKRGIAFDSVKLLLLAKRKGGNDHYQLAIEEKSGSKILVEKSQNKEKLKSLATQIQEWVPGLSFFSSPSSPP